MLARQLTAHEGVIQTFEGSDHFETLAGVCGGAYARLSSRLGRNATRRPIAGSSAQSWNARSMP